MAIYAIRACCTVIASLALSKTVFAQMFTKVAIKFVRTLLCTGFVRLQILAQASQTSNRVVAGRAISLAALTGLCICFKEVQVIAFRTQIQTCALFTMGCAFIADVRQCIGKVCWLTIILTRGWVASEELACCTLIAGTLVYALIAVGEASKTLVAAMIMLGRTLGADVLCRTLSALRSAGSAGQIAGFWILS